MLPKALTTMLLTLRLGGDTSIVENLDINSQVIIKG